MFGVMVFRSKQELALTRASLNRYARSEAIKSDLIIAGMLERISDEALASADAEGLALLREIRQWMTGMDTLGDAHAVELFARMDALLERFQ